MQHVLASPHVDVFRLSGHLNPSNLDALQQDLAQAILSSKSSVFIVDMDSVESLDSTGLMALVSALNLAQERGQSFALSSVSPSVRIILEMTQLDQAFEICDDSSDIVPLESKPPIIAA